MIFIDNKVSFGRHQTFALRYSWLTKGFQELTKDRKIFTDENATVKLGVGKNMVDSIRYWVHATQVAEPDKSGFHATELGDYLFGENGLDIYLEDEATIWLIHWLLASNPRIATSWYWFFNYFHQSEFTPKEVLHSLREFSDDNVRANVALGTLKKDVDVILRMYSSSKLRANQAIEDILDSPLSLLNLISHSPNTKSFYSFPKEQHNVPIGIFGYAIASLFQYTSIRSIPIENLMYKKADYPALGAVFRMTESALLNKLEQLLHYIPEYLVINETAGINQLHQIKEINPLKYLEKHYSDTSSMEIEA